MNLFKMNPFVSKSLREDIKSLNEEILFKNALRDNVEVKQLVAAFLDLWKRAFTANTLSEVKDLREQAFERWGKVEKIVPEDMTWKVMYGQRFKLLDWESTGYPMPEPSAAGHYWRVNIFQAQMDRIEECEFK